MNFQIIHFSYVASTQELAKNLLKEGAVIVADVQNNGKGRYGRTWYSPPGGLWLTAILRSSMEPQIFSLLGGITIAKSLGRLKYKTCLKWPNDVLFKGKKLAGVIGDYYKGYILLGMGINLQNEIPEEIKDIAINIPEISPNALLPIILEALDNEMKKDKIGIIEDWKNYNCTLGKRVKIMNDEEFIGIAKDITSDGFLMVEKDDSTEKIIAGDVILLE